MKDYYYILGVEANCTFNDIKDAYRKLSKKFHPDLNQNDSYFESRFKEIQEAYETLSDPKSRRRYDEHFFGTKAYSSTPDPEPVKQRRYPRTTAIDIIFTIVLVCITIMFGKYVIASMSGTPKTAKVATAATPVNTPQIAAAPVKHHKKKKHSFIADNYFKEKPAPVTAPVVKKDVQRPVKNNDIEDVKIPVKVKVDTFKPKPQPVVTVARPIQPPVRMVSNTGDNDIPYSSLIRANITGVVNMRRLDNLNSDIVAVIPTHSKVLVLQKGSSYYKVQFNGDEGYVPKWTVLTK